MADAPRCPGSGTIKLSAIPTTMADVYQTDDVPIRNQNMLFHPPSRAHHPRRRLTVPKPVDLLANTLLMG